MSTSEMSLLTTTSPKEPSRPTGTQVGARGSSTPSSSRQSVVPAGGLNLQAVMDSLPWRVSYTINVEQEDWTKPTDLTAEMIRQARRSLPHAESLLRPVDRDILKAWMVNLGILCAGQMTAGDAKVKIAAYLPLMDIPPASIVTKRTLADAGNLFKWFPSFAEINQFFRERSFPMVRLAARLKQLADTTPQIEHQPGSDWNSLTPEQKAEIDRKLKEAKRALDVAAKALG